MFFFYLNKILLKSKLLVKIKSLTTKLLAKNKVNYNKIKSKKEVP